MEYSAVLFDLFGTLRPGEAPANSATTCHSKWPAISESTPTRSQPSSARHSAKRTLGQLGTLEETLRHSSLRLGGSPSADDHLRRRATHRDDSRTARRHLGPRRARRASRPRLLAGLVSDCSIDVLIRPESALAERFDAAAFSAVHGIKKPAAELYRVATDALGVAPEQCVYVGDAQIKLPGAAEELGMRAVWSTTRAIRAVPRILSGRRNRHRTRRDALGDVALTSPAGHNRSHPLGNSRLQQFNQRHVPRALRVLFLLVAAALIDIITRADSQVQHLPKLIWILLVVGMPVIGASRGSSRA